MSAAPFCRGEEMVGLLAAESLVELGRVPGVVLAVEHERGTGDQRRVTLEGVGGNHANDGGHAVCSVHPRSPLEGPTESVGPGIHDVIDEGACLHIACVEVFA